ncbi:regulated potassium-efflux system protein KefC [Seminavis robusta]|uniref:Regulated potassium-efflux system protein KefC n=1 Tax=Seminavis robusta TaxID=568900 RepID=A0A9N8E1B5_9STRA|nr:regulated potassium-efflux system protein KefC [Seminavis robusta]|eukprot:Sro435_g142320.1 regulated potassium-efflux system protein KefC (859) ;mRNA; f:27528-30485
MKRTFLLFLAVLVPSCSISASSSSGLRGGNLGHGSANPAKEETQQHSVLFQKGFVSTWLDENVWDHPVLAADRVVFQLPESFTEQSGSASSLDTIEVDPTSQQRLLEGEVVPTNQGEGLVVSVTFREIYKVIIFIAFAWLLGTLSVYIGLPSLVGEIVAGFLLGPPLANFVPFPGALVLAGNIGLIGLILESGIGLDVAQLTEVGSRALVMAVLGSSMPLLAGFGVGRWIGKDVKSAIAVGAAFAPSSLGVASAALSAGEVLNTPIGQLIVASSVFDDVFGLILLSILEVFANPNPTAFDYILPFLASFGYLVVLGLLGITVLPKLIEKKILPLVAEDHRDQFAMILMMLLMTAYMLALNYSGASYLTGVFLAGMTFSQIHTVHASFQKHGRPLLEWLLRIFFSATIGFQVPVKFFSKVYVIKWGFALLLPVFAKVPLGFLVPHFQRDIPQDFPYNPYFRDVIVTSLSMACRGEFNFIVASYALSQGLFQAETYSAVIFAVLFGSIVCPLVLSKVLQYYNTLSIGYLEGKHPIERIGNTCDGYRPLFLAIQARTPVHWSLQEAFERSLAEHGLLIIDHRSWHTLGNSKEAVDITELFVQDTKVRVRIKGCFGTTMSGRRSGGADSSKADQAIKATDMEELVRMPTSNSPDSSINEETDELGEIQARCEEIRKALSECLVSDSPEDYAIQVSQWEAFVVDKSGPSERQRFYSFHSNVAEDAEKDGEASAEATSFVDSSSEQDSKPRLLRKSTTHSEHPDEGPSLSQVDLWEVDNGCHDACREGYVQSPDCKGWGVQNITEGPDVEEVARPRSRRHLRAVSFDASLLTAHETERDLETNVIRDRLHGYVRHGPLLPLHES